MRPDKWLHTFFTTLNITTAFAFSPINRLNFWDYVAMILFASYWYWRTHRIFIKRLILFMPCLLCASVSIIFRLARDSNRHFRHFRVFSLGNISMSGFFFVFFFFRSFFYLTAVVYQRTFSLFLVFWPFLILFSYFPFSVYLGSFISFSCSPRLRHIVNPLSLTYCIVTHSDSVLSHR